MKFTLRRCDTARRRDSGVTPIVDLRSSWNAAFRLDRAGANIIN
jgi:hypothetical protein